MTDPEAVKRYHAPEYQRLLRAARRRLENNGGTPFQVTLHQLSTVPSRGVMARSSGI
ncbi:hypothetical protein [Microbispora sp. GKU 823]|uniref:hypothetical protein n=1 Tax=Microbispora sp. GKU 823 TaxID=1652100 RepID=UPI0015C4C848|nr:hypothetical protein [Microbispora sp. GKU 823]